jgi:hypothetical protein
MTYITQGISNLEFHKLVRSAINFKSKSRKFYNVKAVITGCFHYRKKEEIKERRYKNSFFKIKLSFLIFYLNISIFFVQASSNYSLITIICFFSNINL